MVAKLADQLRQALWKGRVHELERLLPLLAEAIYPEDPIQARMALLQIVGLAGSQVDLPVQAVHNLVRRLLPRERVPGATAQIGLLAQQIAPGSWNIEAAATYLDQLPVEFPEAPAQALARGRVLEALAWSGHRAGIHPYFLPPRTLGILNRLIGSVSMIPG